jgi:hypothetical protein
MEFPDEEEFERKVIPFHSKHLHFVDDLLKRANITDTFRPFIGEPRRKAWTSCAAQKL